MAKNNNIPLNFGTIVQKQAGYCLFNGKGKLVAIKGEPLQIFQLAKKIGIKLFNVGSAIGKQIIENIGG